MKCIVMTQMSKPVYSRVTCSQFVLCTFGSCNGAITILWILKPIIALEWKLKCDIAPANNVMDAEDWA